MKPTLKDIILESVDEIVIYERYMGQRVKLGRAIRCPFPGKKDKHPSFSLYRSKSGKILWKYFSDDKRGDVFSFVQNMLGIGFKECLDQIAQDFIINKNEKKMPIIKYDEVEKYLIKESKNPENEIKSLYTFGIKGFSSDEFSQENNPNLWQKMLLNETVKEIRDKFSEYFSAYGVDVDIDSGYNYFPLLYFRFNHPDKKEESSEDFIFSPNVGETYLSTKKYISESDISITLNDILNLKIAFKYANKRKKIYTPFGHSKHFSNTKGTDVYYPILDEKTKTKASYALCSGPKDSICLHANTGIYGVSLNSESCIPDYGMALDIKEQFPRLVTVYDADDTGIASSKKLYDLHGIPYVNLKYFVEIEIRSKRGTLLSVAYKDAIKCIKCTYINLSKENHSNGIVMATDAFDMKMIKSFVADETKNRVRLLLNVFHYDFRYIKDIADICRFSGVINPASIAIAATRKMMINQSLLHVTNTNVSIIQHKIEPLELKLPTDVLTKHIYAAYENEKKGTSV